MQKKFYKKEDPNVKISKSLSYILRHGAVKEGIPIQSDGFVKMSDLLQHRNFKNVTLEKIQEVVLNNNKKRFELIEKQDGNQTEFFIRANQGHTLTNIEDDELLTKIEDPSIFPQVIHGTYTKFWNAIQAEGLKTMSRNHIHFAPGLPNEQQVISGMRSSCDIYIEIDMLLAVKDGIEFYLSKNNVILTRGVNGVLHPRYFKKVVKRNGQIIFSSDQNDQQQQQQLQYQQPQQLQQQNQEEFKQNNQIQLQNQQKPQQKEQEYDYLLVLDFEAQCENNVKFDVQEIIELPVIVIDVKSQKILEKEFHYYIKPTKYSQLTQFCKDLTGIQQEWVDQGILLQEALQKLDQFLIDSNIKNKKFMFVTCGDWDLKTCLRNEAKYKNIVLENYLKSWVNIKFVFEKQFGYSRVGMVEMLKALNIDLVGRHHSGIDDARNIAQITLKLINLGQTITLANVKKYT